MKRLLFLFTSHAIALAIGFALGIYFLPIITAPPSPDDAVLEAAAGSAEFTVELTRDLRGSDTLHWGDGTVSVTPQQIVHQGTLAPGPDYKVYLTRDFVEHEDEFEPIKSNAALIGDVNSFDGFLLNVPEGVDVRDYTTVVVWCESFGEFITAGKYR